MKLATICLLIAYLAPGRALLGLPLLPGLLDPPPASGSSRSFPPSCNDRSQPNPNNGLPFCCLSTDALTAGRVVAGNQVQPSTLPYWANLTLAAQGQAFAKNNLFAITLASMAGLLIGMPVPDANNILAFTNYSSTADNSTKRYLATGTQYFVWLDSLVNADLTGPFFTSIQNVRVHHIAVVNAANAVPKPLNAPNKFDNVSTDDIMWSAIAQDYTAAQLTYTTYPAGYLQYDATALPINQFVQGLTVLGFMGCVIANPTASMIYNASEGDLRAIIGYAIGVNDNYNVCLQPNVTSAQEYFHDIQNKYVNPGFLQTSKLAKVLTEAFLGGIQSIVPGFDPRTVMYRVLRDYAQIPVPHLYTTLSPADVLIQTGWESVFVPSTQLQATRDTLNAAVSTGINTAIVALFGPYLTTMQQAQNVYYPKTEM